jgi:CRISPR-associated protein Csb3
MNTFVMNGADPHVLLHHLAFYGLADILHSAAVPDVQLTWEGTHPAIHGEQLTHQLVDDAVRAHIEGRRAWTEVSIGPERRGVMSPRLSALKSRESWADLHHHRHRVLDELVERHAWADLRYLAALGEPSYWRFTPKQEPLQDDGASRWEMQPRNRGSEFVANRLRPLSSKLLARDSGQIASGLDGSTTVDELGGQPDSVTATGLSTPGPVDNALAWCALWGIGQFPLTLGTRTAAVSAGHIGRGRREWFCVPIWAGAWRAARLRTVLTSHQLRQVAASALPDVPGLTADPLALQAAANWLRARHVTGLLRFPIGRFGSDNAPERRALRAEVVPFGPAR